MSLTESPCDGKGVAIVQLGLLLFKPLFLLAQRFLGSAHGSLRDIVVNLIIYSKGI